MLFKFIYFFIIYSIIAKISFSSSFQNELRENESRSFLVSHHPPLNFQPYAEAAGCYCTHQDKILFLKRCSKKSYGNTWGIPGGKIDQGEKPLEAVIREVFEEVGLDIKNRDVFYIAPLYLSNTPDKKDFVLHLFSTNFSFLPIVHLNLEEHIDYRWLNISEISKLPLILGGKEALQVYQNHKREGIEK